LKSTTRVRDLRLEQRDLLLCLLKALPHRCAVATVRNEADEIVEAPAFAHQLLLLTADQLGT